MQLVSFMALLMLQITLACPISLHAVTELPLVPHQIIEAMPPHYDRRIRAGVHAGALDPGYLAIL